MKFVCVGHATYDITLPVENYPIENKKQRISQKIECGGGPACNASYLLGKWNSDVSFVGVVGNDYYGQQIIKELNSIGVNTEYVEKNSSTDTDSSYIVSNLGNGTRTILTTKKKEIASLDNPVDITDASYVLVDGEHYITAKEVLLRNPKAISVLDAGRFTKEVVSLGQIVNYVVCSKEFAENFSKINVDYNNPNSIIEIYKVLKSFYKDQTVIITLEDKGSFTCIDNNYHLIPSIKVKTVDSTGAGDIFHGAFIYFLSQNYPLEKVIKLASITSALSVTKIGSRLSIPELEEVSKVYSNYETI